MFQGSRRLQESPAARNRAAEVTCSGAEIPLCGGAERGRRLGLWVDGGAGGPWGFLFIGWRPNIGVRARAGNHGEIPGRELRCVGGDRVAMRVQAVSGRNARRGQSRWRAWPSRQGERRRWLAGLLARSERLQRPERSWAGSGRCSGRVGAAQEEKGSGLHGRNGRGGLAGEKSWAEHFCWARAGKEELVSG